MDKKWLYALIAYVVGSFFGFQAVLGLFSGMAGKGAAAA